MHAFYKEKTVWVTGGAGFIGSHLVDQLAQHAATVIVFDNLITGAAENLARHEHAENVQLIETDLTHSTLTAVLEEAPLPDVVFHLASPASPRWYQAHPQTTYQVNAFVTHQLLTFLQKRAPDARFLFASTSEVYGDPLEHPQSESYWGNVNPNGIRSCYDESKRLGETICGVFYRECAIDTRIVRIFNTYGPRLNLNDGRVISNFISQSLAGEKLTIYGDGSQTRSYCFVDDLVRGLLLFMASEVAAGETINLGNPDEFSVLETAQLVHELVHGEALHEGLVAFQDLPADDPTRRKPDISKAHDLLDWYPEILMRDGLKTMITFYRQQHSS